MEDARVEKNIALLREGFALVESRQVEAAATLLAEPFVANLPGMDQPLVGREVWALGTHAMLAAFPDLKIEVKDIFGAGDRVAVRLRFTGTHSGLFDGIGPTGRKVAFSSVEIYRVADGKVAEEWVSPDMLGLTRQIS